MIITTFNMGSIWRTLKKWSLLLILCLAFFAFFYFNLQQYLRLSTIQTYESTIQQWAQLHYPTAVVAYVILFALLIACTIPCATLLTLLGGFLFGSIAVLYASIGTTLGGVILFFAVRSAFGTTITARSAGWIKQVENGFRHNAFNYILFLRLIPVMPCWVSNVSAGALNVPLKTFVFATIIGVFPATFIYTMVGRGLDKLLTAEQTLGLGVLLTPAISLPLLGLAMLSLFPVIYKRLKKS